MIKDLCAIIKDCHNVWIIMFIVIVERIKENSQACPKIRATKDSAIVRTFIGCVP
jgi:hypothetical protein